MSPLSVQSKLHLLLAGSLLALSACSPPPQDTTPESGPTPMLCTDSPFYVDGDGDGVGGSRIYTQNCEQPLGAVLIGGDCDDQDPKTFPGARDVCDGIDNNCDGSIDESQDNQWYDDKDQDGFGSYPNELGSCFPPKARSLNQDDCNDRDPLVFPSAQEHCNDEDDDCDQVIDEDGLTYGYVDADLDGHGAGDFLPLGNCSLALKFGASALGDDCDDTDPDRFPDNCEVADGRDQDCDSAIDENTVIYSDNDKDGFGDDESARPYDCTLEPIQVGPQEVFRGGDCDDDERTVYEGARELCDLLDNDCDGQADEGYDVEIYYLDSDGDGYGDANSWGRYSCEPLLDYVTEVGDCDDDRGDVYPGAPELCDGLDNDCNGLVEDSIPREIYIDADSDGHGVGERPLRMGCGLRAAESYFNDDCDDDDSKTSPSSPELCDSKDNDCDGLVEDDLPAYYFDDNDGDGYPGTNYGVKLCGAGGTNLKSYQSDCDDDDPSIYPGAADPIDDIDQDCGGRDGDQPSVGAGSWSFDSLQAAINAAESGDTLWIAPGERQEPSLDLKGKSLVIRGLEGQEATHLIAAEGGPIFADITQGETLELYDLTLRGGESVEGGALTLKESTLYGERVTLRGNKATGRGGAIFAQDSYVSLSVVNIDDNEAGLDGGGIFVEGGTLWARHVYTDTNLAGGMGGGMASDNTVLHFRYGSLTGNHAEQGGGLAMSGGSLSSVQTEFYLNGSGLGGGGIFADSISGQLYGAVSSNYSGGDGGGALIIGSTVYFGSTTFKGNQARGDGGGLALRDSQITSDTVYSTHLDGNIAAGQGGAIAQRGGESNFSIVYLTGNSASSHGGGMALLEGGVLTAQLLGGSNQAAGDGGQLFCQDSSATVWGTFTSNKAGLDGGAIAIDEGCDLTLSEALLSSNTALEGFGGAIAVKAEGTLEGADLRLTDNVASLGGALSVAVHGDAWVSQAFLQNNIGGTGRDIFTMGTTTLGHSLIAPSTQADNGEEVAALSQYHGYLNLWNSILEEPRESVTLMERLGGDLNLGGNVLDGNLEGAGLDLGEIEATNHLGSADLLVEDWSSFYTSDPHLSLTSPAIDLGVPWDCRESDAEGGEGNGLCLDVDGSPPDAGLFGGPLGDVIDWDQDHRPAYPWPGSYDDVPPSLEQSDYDRNDLNRNI